MSTEAHAFVMALPAGWIDVDLDPSALRQRFGERFGTAATSDLEVRRALVDLFDAIAGTLDFAAA